MRSLVFFIAFLFTFYASGQLKKIARLSDELNEISGLEQLNDSTYAAINDGGDKPVVYLINLKGEILKKVVITNAKNKDWEDLTRDSNNLYIADLGNNNNSREKLKIYKIKIKDILLSDSVKASKISIQYGDQQENPAMKENKNFDVEAIAFKNDSIWIFTKCNTSPWTGISKVYKCPKKSGKYTLHPVFDLYIGSNGWYSDAVTSADIHQDTLYLITYRHVYQYAISPSEIRLIHKQSLGKYTQKESVVFLCENKLLVADEVQKIIGGGKLYKLELK